MAGPNAGGGKAGGRRKDGRLPAEVDREREAEDPVGGEAQPGISTGIIGPVFGALGRVALASLGVADPVLTDKDDDGVGAPDGVFKGRNTEDLPKLAAIEKVEKPWSSANRSSGGRGAAGRADEDIEISPLPMRVNLRHLQGSQSVRR